MKPNLKKTTLLLMGIFAGSLLYAQTPDSAATKDFVRPFSGGKLLNTWSVGIDGGITTMYNILSTKDQSDFTHPASSFGYGFYVKKQFLPALGIQADFLRGKLVGSVAQPDPTNPLTSYSTKLNWGTSISAYFTLANINWRSERPVVQPYLTFGGGVINYTPIIQHTGGPNVPFKDQGGKHDIYDTYIPVGIGAKFNVTNNLSVDLGYQIHFVNSDNLDGYNYGSNSDKFSYIHLGLEWAFGSSAKPQMATHNPVSSLRTEYLTGDLANKAALQSEVDAQKAKDDKINSDLANTNATLAKLTADSDNDGVVDAYDKCPNTPPGTKVDGSGCPIVVTADDKKVLKESIKNLEFDYGKASLRPTSLPGLDNLAQLLIDRSFSLKLGGHTDSKGSAKLNMILSKARTESIKHYLVSKGVNPSRVEAVGYGQTQPIASNKTAKGRQINRRVEFTLY